MTIKIRIKNVYGNDLIYPACDISNQFVKLTERKTFKQSDLEIIKNLGYKIEQVI